MCFNGQTEPKILRLVPAELTFWSPYHHQGCGLRVVSVEHGGQVEDVGPGDLPQHRVSHRHIEPVVSARVGNLRTWVDSLSSTF